MKRGDRIDCPECGRPDTAVKWVINGNYGVHTHRRYPSRVGWCTSAGRFFYADPPPPGADERRGTA